MKNKTPNKNKYWFAPATSGRSSKEVLWYVKDNTARIGAGLFGPPILATFFLFEIMFLETPEVGFAIFFTFLLGGVFWLALTSYLCDRTKNGHRCSSSQFHPFTIFHKETRIMTNCDIKQEFMKHRVYREAVESFVDTAVKNHDTTPWKKWISIIDNLNVEMEKQKEILRKQQEDVTLDHYVEALQLENKMLNGEQV